MFVVVNELESHHRRLGSLQVGGLAPKGFHTQTTPASYGDLLGLVIACGSTIGTTQLQSTHVHKASNSGFAVQA